MEANKLALDLLESAHYELGLYDNFWPFLKFGNECSQPICDDEKYPLKAHI